MANENQSVTLALIRSGSKQFVLDTVTCSDSIKKVQQALRVMGYWGSPDDPDGVFGEFSVAATRGYQYMNGITITGNMNKETLLSIEKFTGTLYAGHSTTPSIAYISKGLDYATLNDTGAAITTITTLLKNLGFLTESTSTFTSTVKTAVGNFQSQYGLTKDYYVGEATYAALMNPNVTDWLASNGKVTLTAGTLARCGFNGTLLLPTFINALTAALSLYGINTKTQIRHFLAQVRAETNSGLGIIEGGYKAGQGVYNKGVLRSYSPYGGAGFLHLSTKANYTDFGGAIGDDICQRDKYAMQYVAINYPGKSAGWFWKKWVDPNVTWSADSDTIGKEVTHRVTGSTDTTKWTSTRKGYYDKICKVLV